MAPQSMGASRCMEGAAEGDGGARVGYEESV